MPEQLSLSIMRSLFFSFGLFLHKKKAPSREARCPVSSKKNGGDNHPPIVEEVDAEGIPSPPRIESLETLVWPVKNEIMNHGSVPLPLAVLVE
jgi:hypothetical protein